MKLGLWELLFFSSLIGAIIFYPLAWRDFDYFLNNNYNFFILTLASLLFFFDSWIVSLEKRGGWWLLLRFLLVFIALILAGMAVEITSPIFTLWFASIILTLLSFGYIIAFHLFRRAERDLISKWKEIISVSLAVNFFRLVVVFLLAFFPIPPIAFLIAIVMLFFRRYE